MHGYENAARLLGERRMLSLEVVSVVANRIGKKGVIAAHFLLTQVVRRKQIRLFVVIAGGDAQSRPLARWDEPLASLCRFDILLTNSQGMNVAI